MATKATAAKTGSAAVTSKYDVKTEERPQVLEEKLNSSSSTDQDRIAALESRFELLLARLQETPGVKSRVSDI